jgi:hypothetical protein
MLNIVIPHYREPRLERLEYRPWPISLSQAGRGLNPLLSLKERAVPVFLLTGGRPNTASCPAWPEETGPAGVIGTVLDGPKPACSDGPYRLGTAWSGRSYSAAIIWQLSCNCWCNITNSTQPTMITEITHGGPGHNSSRPMPSNWLQEAVSLFLLWWLLPADY